MADKFKMADKAGNNFLWHINWIQALWKLLQLFYLYVML